MKHLRLMNAPKSMTQGEPCSTNSHKNELCLHVFARHPRLNPYLGEPRETADGIFWSLNDSPGFRSMYAECVAEAVALVPAKWHRFELRRNTRRKT